MNRNPIKFAVVREDPLIEDALVRRVRAQNILLIGSGGCTALTLKALHPELQITLIDPNPAQLDLIERKISALDLPTASRYLAFGVGTEDAEHGLNSSGEFESLFRAFRHFLHEFVLPRQGWMDLLAGDSDPSGEALARVFSSDYWPVAFDLFFSDSLLEAMFTSAATQHAPKGSYPGYFRRVLERTLGTPGARSNYFLHHLFLGHYLARPEALPTYLVKPTEKPSFELVEGSLGDVEDFGKFDLIHLSNIFDWMDQGGVTESARRIADEMKPGACVTYRQLNNESDFRPLFGARVQFDTPLERSLLLKERSGFYMSIGAGFKHGERD